MPNGVGLGSDETGRTGYRRSTPTSRGRRYRVDVISEPGQHDGGQRPGIHPHKFRTPVPVDRFHLSHPNVPERASGLTVLHSTDTHVRRARERYRVLCRVLERIEVDLVLLTGDFMTFSGDEPVALRIFEAMSRAWTARLGAFGVFGNHDSPAFRRAVRDVADVTWLDPGTHDLPDAGIRLVGTSWPEDWLAARLEADTTHDDLFQLGLAHSPASLPAASRLGIDTMLAGHTHGGQLRMHLPGLFSWAPHTSTDLHRHHPSGVLRLRDTLCCISRGLGEQIVELRVQCPKQLPLYTLERGPMPGRHSERITRPVHW